MNGAGLRLRIRLDPVEIMEAAVEGEREATIDSRDIWRIKTAWQGLYASGTPSMVLPASDTTEEEPS